MSLVFCRDCDIHHLPGQHKITDKPIPYSLWIDGMSLEELRAYTYGLYGRMLEAEQAQWNAEFQLSKIRCTANNDKRG
jgi:hypothetical protein